MGTKLHGSSSSVLLNDTAIDVRMLEAIDIVGQHAGVPSVRLVQSPIRQVQSVLQYL